MAELSVIDWIATILVIIGGLNWGLVGVFNFNFVNWVFGSAYVIAQIIYIIVGVAALWMILKLIVPEV